MGKELTISVDMALLMISSGHTAGQLYSKKEIVDKDEANKFANALLIKILEATVAKKVDAGKAAAECYECIHKHSVPGNAHIECGNPDVEMTGDAHGIKHGWFIYPILFDPTWKTKYCSNFKKK